MTKRWRFRVKGKVQGVYFRKSTAEMANKAGLLGWVQNEDDGSVLLEVEGEEDVLRPFISWLSQGPDLAIVIGIDQDEIPILNTEYTFEVRR